MYVSPKEIAWDYSGHNQNPRNVLLVNCLRNGRNLFSIGPKSGNLMRKPKKLPPVCKKSAFPFGPTAPAGHQGQGIKANPSKGWFTYFRIYGPGAPAFNGSWETSKK